MKSEVEPTFLSKYREELPDTAQELADHVECVGLSRARLWLTSKDPYHRSRVAQTSGAGYALLMAVKAISKRKLAYEVVLDP